MKRDSKSYNKIKFRKQN